MYLIHILIEYPVHALNQTFTYYYDAYIPKGVRVEVHFSRKQCVGYVLDSEKTNKDLHTLELEYGFKIKKIKHIIDDKPLLNDELIELAKRLSRLTITPLISCLSCMLPGNLKPTTHKDVHIKYKKAVRIISDQPAKTPKQNECLELLSKNEYTFLRDIPYSEVLIKNLVKQHLVEIYDQEVYRDPYKKSQVIQDKEITLTIDQNSVVKGIIDSEKMISLLYGVTGSGKTEVYIALSRYMLQQGKTVLMLVPEISLTPMMVEIFKQRFDEDVAIFHSKLSSGERYDEYRKISQGEVKIVVGARSAVFAPLKNIGLIIMDEEHDTSYKQENTPRYHTLEVAKMRAEYHHAKIVLGSATPSIESYARSQKGIYDYYELTHRINNKPLPKVDIINMEDEIKNNHYSRLSTYMIEGIKHSLDNNEQAIIMINRRGYASFVKCMDCGEVVKCPHCDVTLTYHKDENKLKCHHCEYMTPMLSRCPNCQGKLKKIGYGTQKIEEDIQDLFPDKRILRFDFDSTRNKNKHLQLLEQFSNHKADIMLGTQMISKGLDFENVTFVGILNADITLTLPDFRASEKTFQLICQVSGRSGRGEKEGKVVLQTYNPDHYAIIDGAKQDYKSFYQKEIEYRKKALYPPYCHLCAIIVQSVSQDRAHNASLEIAQYLNNKINNIQVLGPAPLYIHKMKDIYRERIIIKYFKLQPLHKTLENLTDYYNKKGQVLMICDFHPMTQI